MQVLYSSFRERESIWDEKILEKISIGKMLSGKDGTNTTIVKCKTFMKFFDPIFIQ
jgi:hypothetical protein